MDRNDSVDTFLTEFNLRKQELEQLINSLQESLEKKEELKDKLSKINDGLSRLRKDVSDAQIFLPSYTSKTIQTSLTTLSGHIDKVKESVQPKKKFTFGTKNLKKSEVDHEKQLAKDVVDSVSALPSVEMQITEGLHDKSHEKIAVYKEEASRKDYQMRNLIDCEVDIIATPSSVFMKNLTRCHIRCGPVFTSIFISDCKDCKFSLCCQQLRVHSSHGCQFFTRTTSDPIIEDCADLTFAPYDFSYNEIEKDFSTTGIPRQGDREMKVVDFNWLSTDEPSPNFTILCPDKD